MSAAESNWYETAFDALYLTLYAHRNREDARRAIEFIEREIAPRPEWTALDLCCGAGRHLAELSRLGCAIVGLDLSRPLLGAAASHLREDGLPRRLVQASMDAFPFRAAAFDLIVNLFTSFGYFANDERNAAVIAQAGRALKPGGRLLIDFMNAPWVRASLTPRSETITPTQLRVETRRSIEGSPPRVVKRMRVTGRREEREIVESVRLFERAELEAMMRGAGLSVEGAWGDFDGRAYGEMAPRCVLVGRK